MPRTPDLTSTPVAIKPPAGHQLGPDEGEIDMSDDPKPSRAVEDPEHDADSVLGIDRRAEVETEFGFDGSEDDRLAALEAKAEAEASDAAKKLQARAPKAQEEEEQAPAEAESGDQPPAAPTPPEDPIRAALRELAEATARQTALLEGQFSRAQQQQEAVAYARQQQEAAQAQSPQARAQMMQQLGLDPISDKDNFVYNIAVENQQLRQQMGRMAGFLDNLHNGALGVQRGATIEQEVAAVGKTYGLKPAQITATQDLVADLVQAGYEPRAAAERAMRLFSPEPGKKPAPAAAAQNQNRNDKVIAMRGGNRLPNRADVKKMSMAEADAMLAKAWSQRGR